MHQFQIKTIIIQIKMRLITRHSQYMSPAVCHQHTYLCTHHVCGHVIMNVCVCIDLMGGFDYYRCCISAFSDCERARTQTHSRSCSYKLYLAICAHLTLVRLISHTTAKTIHHLSVIRVFAIKCTYLLAVISTN